MRALDLTGTRFGRLVALCRAETPPGRNAMWGCVCDCGATHAVAAHSLASGNTQSCGCLRHETSILVGKANRRSVVGYAGAHQRTISTRGKAAEHMCPCGAPAREWAYSNADPDERTEMVTSKGSTSILAYSLDPQHYEALCKPCHRQIDATHRALTLAHERPITIHLGG